MLIDKHLNIAPSLAWELYETKGESWLTSGWSLDVITTSARGGFGIAKDVFENKLLEIDVGGYVTQGYTNLWESKTDFTYGMGLNMQF